MSTEKYRHLREAAQAVEKAQPGAPRHLARLRQEVARTAPNQYFTEHQDEIDERAHPDPAARFVHQPNGQMYMTEGTPLEHKLPDTTVVDHGDGTSSTHLAGVETQPYLTRPQPQGKQLPLGKSGAFRPDDPALHAIRLQNPHLNDYHFSMYAAPHGYHNIEAYHNEMGHAGTFSWRGGEHAKRAGEPHRAGEVEMIEVKDQHKGRGLGTAMWDYAHFHAGREGSTIDHPVHSDNRSIEGNHWAHFVGGASLARTKGFGVQRY